MYNPFSLTGKTILVVGASSGIGQSTAIECSKMGAKVIVSARSEEGLSQTISMMSGDSHQMIKADITNEEDIKKLVDNITKIDGLVLSVGKGLTRPISFCTKEHHKDIFDINLFSQIELVRIFYKQKKITKGGSIVIIASIAGISSWTFGNSIYGASKAAINSYIRYFAKEFAARKIRVNAICPGMINTNFINRGTLTDEDFKKDMEAYPLKRYGEPEEVAYGCVYLLSDATAWVTGSSLVVDGGGGI